MKKILLILLCFVSITAVAQREKNKFGLYRIDSLYGNYESSTDTTGRYVIMHDPITFKTYRGPRMGNVGGGGGGGYTNLTQFVAQTNHRLFYSDGSGDVQELAYGSAGTFLGSNGTTSAPSFQNLANLTATDATITFSGTPYNGSTARTIGLNLGNANTFTADQSVPDEAYDATNWNGSVEVPTKNALRDQMELYQLLSNLSTTTTLGTSNTLYPSQNAVKVYVDNTAAAQTPKAAVDYATAAALAANTYANGASGVGATITMNATGTVTIDGHVTALNENILIKDESSQLKNGIYTVTTAGAGGVAGVFTRRTDFDVIAEVIPGAFALVINGTANAGKVYTQTNTVATMGTDAIAFVQTGGASGVAWGAITGTLSSQTDLQNALDLKANLASPTFTGTVVLPSSTVTNAMLAGSIDLTTKVTGVLPAANGGTGVNNSTRTLTVNTNSGTLAFSAASKTLTVAKNLTLDGTDGTTMTFPSTNATIARTDAAQTFTGVQTLSSAPVLSTGTVTVSGNTVTFPTTAVTLASLTGTETLTNKRITKRSGTVASSATPTINTDNVDLYTITALTTAITSMTTNLSGSPTEGDYLEIWITGTAARGITWGASFADGTVALPTTTVTTQTMMVLLQRKGSLWICKAAASSTN